MSHPDTERSVPDPDFRISEPLDNAFTIEVKEEATISVKLQIALGSAELLPNETSHKIEEKVRDILRLVLQAKEERENAEDLAALRRLSSTAMTAEEFDRFTERMSHSLPTDEPPWVEDDG